MSKLKRVMQFEMKSTRLCNFIEFVLSKGIKVMEFEMKIARFGEIIELVSFVKSQKES